MQLNLGISSATEVSVGILYERVSQRRTHLHHRLERLLSTAKCTQSSGFLCILLKSFHYELSIEFRAADRIPRERFGVKAERR